MRRTLPLLAAVFFFGACARRVHAGSLVDFHYTLYVDGHQDDTDEDGPPAEITQGNRDVIAGLDDGLLGMKAGETRDIVLPPEKGFGPPDPKLIETMPLSDFGAMAARLRPGAIVHGMRDGKAADGRVVELKAGKVVLDFNHRLAAKTLRFHVRVVSVR